VLSAARIFNGTNASEALALAHILATGGVHTDASNLAAASNLAVGGVSAVAGVPAEDSLTALVVCLHHTWIFSASNPRLHSVLEFADPVVLASFCRIQFGILGLPIRTHFHLNQL
jgi:hypothetical protein